MKFLVYADPHWSKYSSILRKRGEKYSVRLENLINSLNWVEATAKENGCLGVVCLGDFFDKSELTSEEITALNDVKWDKSLSHYFIVGNHEMGNNDLTNSSAHLFNMVEKSFVVSDVSYITLGNTDIYFIPYILESCRKPFSEYITNNSNKKLVFSHNDLKMNYGMCFSNVGFDIDEVSKCCDLFVNGHIHNFSKVNDKIINLGNLTGQNFSEDGSKYNHYAMVIDTKDLTYELLENPYSFKFYKIDISDEHKPLEYLDSFIKDYSNAIVSAKVNKDNIEDVSDYLKSRCVDSRVVYVANKDVSNSVVCENKVGCADHLEQFKNYIIETLGCDDIINEELLEVLK